MVYYLFPAAMRNFDETMCGHLLSCPSGAQRDRPPLAQYLSGNFVCVNDERDRYRLDASRLAFGKIEIASDCESSTGEQSGCSRTFREPVG